MAFLTVALRHPARTSKTVAMDVLRHRVSGDLLAEAENITSTNIMRKF